MRIPGMIIVTMTLLWQAGLTAAATAAPAANRSETWMVAQQSSEQVSTPIPRGRSCSQTCSNGSSCSVSCLVGERASCMCYPGGSAGNASCSCLSKKLQPHTQKNRSGL